MSKTRTLPIPNGIISSSERSVLIIAPSRDFRSPFCAVYTCVIVFIAEAASVSFVSYYLMVSGWGDPLVLLEPSTAEQAASGQSNFNAGFAILRKYYRSIAWNLTAKQIS